MPVGCRGAADVDAGAGRRRLDPALDISDLDVAGAGRDLCGPFATCRTSIEPLPVRTRVSPTTLPTRIDPLPLEAVRPLAALSTRMLPEPVRASTAASMAPTVNDPDPDDTFTGPAIDATVCDPEPVLAVREVLRGTVRT
jgi:hypothetical protein